MKMLSKAQREVLEKMADGCVLHVVEHYRPLATSRFLLKDHNWIRGIRKATFDVLCDRGYIERGGYRIGGGAWQITEAGLREARGLTTRNKGADHER